jgi:RNA polymerase sigma-70 factor (family 1)
MKGQADYSMQTDKLLAEALFKAHYSRLCYFAFRFTGSKDQARDIAQEAFVTFLQQQQHISTHPAAIKNFLYTTVRNACLNQLRHEKVVARFEAAQTGTEAEEATVMLTMIRAEVLGEIYRVLETLPEVCQRIIRMGYVDGLQNQKIAEQLGVSINTVKTHKKRGLQLLRLRLNPEVYLLLTMLPYIYR